MYSYLLSKAKKKKKKEKSDFTHEHNIEKIINK